MQIKNEKDFWSGVMFVLWGLGFAVFAQQYDFGSAQRMGPAFFPSMLGVILVVLGILIGAQGLRRKSQDGKLEKFYFGPLAWVLGAIVVYGLLLRQAGILVSMVLLIAISSMGSHEFRWKEVIGLSIVMGVIVYMVFIWGLKLSIPVLPAFLAN